jgi:hypothetical protein
VWGPMLQLSPGWAVNHICTQVYCTHKIHAAHTIHGCSTHIYFKYTPNTHTELRYTCHTRFARTRAQAYNSHNTT